MAEATHKLKLINKLGFSCYQLSTVTETLVNAWQLYFYTTFCNISIIMITSVLAASKLLSAFITPVLGSISDNLYKTKFGRRFGRRKSLLLLAIPCKVLTFPLYWIPGMPTIYYAALLIITAFVNPLAVVSQGTFLAEMTHTPSERAQLAGINQVGAAIAGISSSMATVYFFNVFGDANPMTFFIAALVYDAVSLLMLVFYYFSVFERPVDEAVLQQEMTAKHMSPIQHFAVVIHDFKSAIKLRAYRLYLGMYLSEQMFRSLAGTINTYFIVFVLLLNPKVVSVSTTMGFVFGIGFLSFHIWLTNKTNGNVTYRLGGVSAIIILCGFFYLGVVKPSNMEILLITFIVAMNFGKAGLVNAMQYTFSFIPDIDEVLTARRREGVYSGVSNFLDVLFTTLEVVLIGVLLEVTGFVKNSPVQPQATIDVLLFMYTVVPIAIICVGLAISTKFKLTQKTHKILSEEVQRLKTGGSKTDVTPEAREVIESLTGYAYEKCWGDNDMLCISEEEKSETTVAIK
jgi:oligogalacturonide transporter